jgi:hypothetical protein
VTVKIFANVDHGVALAGQSVTWNFPRVDRGYYEAMVERTKNKINAKPQWRRGFFDLNLGVPSLFARLRAFA